MNETCVSDMKTFLFYLCISYEKGSFYIARNILNFYGLH
jgi:hypothetical protein